MTKMAVTMTIDQRYKFLDSVRAGDEVLRLPYAPVEMCAWYEVTPSEQRVRERRAESLTHAMNAMVLSLPNHTAWLFVSPIAVQPNTAVARKSGLWGPLIGRGLRVDKSDAFQSTNFDTAGVRYFGATRIENNKPNVVSEILGSERAAIIYLEGRQTQIGELVVSGWSRSKMEGFPSLDLLEFANEQNAAIVAISGAFDDAEIVTAIIANGAVLPGPTGR
jgi:hypothetical protein